MKKIAKKVFMYLVTGVGVMKLRTKDCNLKEQLFRKRLGLDFEEELKNDKQFMYTMGVLFLPAIIVDNLIEFILNDIFDLDYWNL